MTASRATPGSPRPPDRRGEKCHDRLDVRRTADPPREPATWPRAAAGPESRSPADRHASPLEALYALSGAMFESRSEAEILQLAMAGVSEVGCTADAGYLVIGEELTRIPAVSASSDPPSGLDRQVAELHGRDGDVSHGRRTWRWAYALRGLAGLCGYLVVSRPVRPGPEEHRLLSVLTQQTSAALSNAVADRRASEEAAELRHQRGELESARRQLSTSLSDLEHQQSVHEALTRVAAAEGGLEGIVRALHEITGLPALIEDRFGNLRAWSGPGRPDPYPKPDPVRRQQMLQDAVRRITPVRVGERVVAPACPRGEVLGVVALVVGDGTVDRHAESALGHAATSLAMELVHRRNLAEVELRTRRELVDDLLEGTDEASAYTRSEAVGHDLHGPHRVVVVRGPYGRTDDVFAQAVERAAARVGMRALLVRRAGTVVLVTRDSPRHDALFDALAVEFGPEAGAVGVGGPCEAPGGVPRSYQEALRALDVQRSSPEAYGMTRYDDLGLYRLLGPRNDPGAVEEFVREWLGSLLDYDSRHRTALVETLSQYFDCGGNYDATASVLAVHRSTLRYRLQRIREISGIDLADVDSRLNLHVATRVWKVLGGAPD